MSYARAKLGPTFIGVAVGLAIVAGVVAVGAGLLWVMGAFTQATSASSGGYSMFISEAPRQEVAGTALSPAASSVTLSWSDYPFRPRGTKLIRVGDQWNAYLDSWSPVHWYRVELEAGKAYAVDLAVAGDESAEAGGDVEDGPRLDAVWDLRGNRVSGEVRSATRPMLKLGRNATLESLTKRVQQLIVVPEMGGFHFIPVTTSVELASGGE